MSPLAKPIIIIVALVATFTLAGSFYTVSETEQVIITRFGKPVGDPVNSITAKPEAGIHFKMPYVDTVNRFEKRVLEWDGPATDMPTRDKLYITVDNFARWRIVDPMAFLVTLRDERSAISRLNDIIGSETRSIIAKHDLIEVVRSDKTRDPIRDEDLAAGNSTYGTLPPIQYGRSKLDREILAAASPRVKPWGVELLDVRFKRINYKAGVIDKIYARMTSERIQIADRFRSEGAGEAATILGTKDGDLLEIESGAYRKEQEIMGKADATATEIYAKAYNSSPLAASFYQFTKTLEIYRQSIGKDTTTIFTTDSDLFSLMKSIGEAVPTGVSEAKVPAPVPAPATAPVPVKGRPQPRATSPVPAPAPVPAPSPNVEAPPTTEISPP